MTAREVAESGPAGPGVDVDVLAAERLTFFSDAVVAIAMTLLALDLPVPQGVTNGEVWASIGQHAGDYVAFLISFIVIGRYWAGHHRLFRYVRGAGGWLVLWNLLWLLTIVVTPFATRVLTADGAFETRFTFYAAVQALSGLCFLRMVRELKVHHLLRPDAPAATLPSAVLQMRMLAAAFLVSIPVAFVTHAAYACWIAAPIGAWIARRLARRHLMPSA
jgi:uncharacterized membrane protein